MGTVRDTEHFAPALCLCQGSFVAGEQVSCKVIDESALITCSAGSGPEDIWEFTETFPMDSCCCY